VKFYLGQTSRVLKKEAIGENEKRPTQSSVKKSKTKNHQFEGRDRYREQRMTVSSYRDQKNYNQKAEGNTYKPQQDESASRRKGLYKGETANAGVRRAG